MSKTPKKDDAAADVAADPMADKRAEYDHAEGSYSEPALKDEPIVRRHQVDPRRDIEVEEGQSPLGPVPRRADPHAAQRDAKAAEKSGKDEAAKDD